MSAGLRVSGLGLGLIGDTADGQHPALPSIRNIP